MKCIIRSDNCYVSWTTMYKTTLVHWLVWRNGMQRRTEHKRSSPYKAVFFRTRGLSALRWRSATCFSLFVAVLWIWYSFIVENFFQYLYTYSLMEGIRPLNSLLIWHLLSWNHWSTFCSARPVSCATCVSVVLFRELSLVNAASRTDIWLLLSLDQLLSFPLVVVAYTAKIPKWNWAKLLSASLHHACVY